MPPNKQLLLIAILYNLIISNLNEVTFNEFKRDSFMQCFECFKTSVALHKVSLLINYYYLFQRN